ncbi:MAG TPA: hypothetical protein VK681_10050 [Reyranella sp.]|nr:hypothetical protein [Reyranella sp.]
MLGFGRAAVASGAPLESRDQLVIEIADVQVSSHRRLFEIIDLNALNSRAICQGAA